MLVLSLAINTAVVLAAAGLAWMLRQDRRAAAAGPPRGWLDELEVDAVIVTLTDGRTIAGYLAGAREDGILIRNARVLGVAATIAAAGEIVIPRDRIAWVQRGIRLDDVGGLHEPSRDDQAQVA